MSPNQCQNCSLKLPQTKSLIRFSVLINSKSLSRALLHLGIHLLVSFGFLGQQIPQTQSQCLWNQTWSVSEPHPAPSPAPSQASLRVCGVNPICLKPSQGCWEFTSPSNPAACSKRLDWANFVTGPSVLSFPFSLLLLASAGLRACQGPPLCDSHVALFLRARVYSHPFFISSF